MDQTALRPDDLALLREIRLRGYPLSGSGNDSEQEISARQGNSLAQLLREGGYRWNTLDGSLPIGGDGLADLRLPQATIKVLGPNKARLEALKNWWIAEMRRLGMRGSLEDLDDVFEFLCAHEVIDPGEQMLASWDADLAQTQASFTGQRGAAGDSKLPPWAICLTREWRQIENLVGADGVATWVKELNRLCAPLGVANVRALERAVSTSFREDHEQPLNRWESRVRHALNLALWSHVSASEAATVEAVLRIYNPSQPERTVQGMSNPVTHQLTAAIGSGDYSAVLGSNATVLLNYHDMAMRPTEEGASHIEVLCLLQPASKRRGFFTPKLEQFFRSLELPVTSMVTTPFETCCRLDPQLVFFGSYTPSIPLPSFRMMVGAEEQDFLRQNWRYARRNEVRGFGQAKREGCSLSVARNALRIPAGFKLAWIVWLDGSVAGFVDEHNNRLI